MADVPEVSVIIPLYNNGLHIARALNSVLAQTVQNFEVIIVDDGSTDDGAEVIRGFDDPRIQLIQQENQGVSAARNRGIEAAQAELVAFLDADDEWLPEHLETLLRLRRRHPEAGAYGTAYFVKATGLKTKLESLSDDIPKEPWEGLLSSYFKAATFGASPITSSTVAIPKSILMEMKGFDTNAWWGEDTDLWGRIALKYPIAFSWDGKGVYHTDVSNRASIKGEPVEEHIFVRNVKELIISGEVPQSKQNDFLEYIARKQLETAWLNIYAKRPDLARTVLKSCNTSKQVKEKYWALFWAHMHPNIYKLSSFVRYIFISTVYKVTRGSLNLFKN